MTNVLNPLNARAQAAAFRARGLCAYCMKVPTLRTELEMREYQISAVCGLCWDEMFPPTPEEL